MWPERLYIIGMTCDDYFFFLSGFIILERKDEKHQPYTRCNNAFILMR